MKRHNLPYVNCLIVASFMLMTCFESCVKHNGITSQQRQACVREGRARALSITGKCAGDTTSIELELLDIKAREKALGEQVGPDAAESYVSSFLSTLDSVNPELSTLIKG